MLTMLRVLFSCIKTIAEFIVCRCLLPFIYRNEDKIHYLPPVRHKYLEYSAVKLADMIRNRELTSEEIVKSYIERIHEINGEINAVVDERFEEAVIDAQMVDKYLEKENPSVEYLKKCKPLLGVPFTVKEAVECKGMSNTYGVYARKGIKGERDADMVANVKDAGAILLGVTNVPEMCIWADTVNYVFGRTNNPYNKSRSVGGSSGGEGALVASCGTAFGVGTDIGSSNRLPATYCGVFGYKPTTTVPVSPMRGSTKRTGLEKITMCGCGPMTRHAEDQLTVFKAMIGENQNLLTLDAKVDLKKLKVYYLEEINTASGYYFGDLELERLHKAVKYLEDVTGNKAEKITLSGTENIFAIWKYYLSVETCPKYDVLIGNGQKVNLYSELFKKLTFRSYHIWPAFIRLFVNNLKPVDKEWAENLKEKMYKELMDILGEDGVLLAPTIVRPAPYQHASWFDLLVFVPQILYNILKMPALHVPMGVNQEGLPIGIHVAAPPKKDHVVFAVAEKLEEGLGAWVPPYKSS